MTERFDSSIWFKPGKKRFYAGYRLRNVKGKMRLEPIRHDPNDKFVKVPLAKDQTTGIPKKND